MSAVYKDKPRYPRITAISNAAWCAFFVYLAARHGPTVTWYAIGWAALALICAKGAVDAGTWAWAEWSVEREFKRVKAKKKAGVEGGAK